MQRTVKFAIVFFVIAFAIGCAAYSLSPFSQKNTLTFEKFDEQWNIIVKEYASVLPDTPEAKLACFRKILAAGLESCLDDRFSSYLSKEEATTTYEMMRGSYAGVGLELDDTDTSVRITSIMKNSPAEKSGGFQLGDVLIEVNGKDVSKQSEKTIVGNIRGPKGTEVTIRVKRNGKKLNPITLIREHISVVSVHAIDIDEDITYIKIDYFNKLTPSEFVSEMFSRLLFRLPNGTWRFNFSAKKFIYDLRENPGGLVEAVGMMSYLFAEDDDHIVITEWSRNREYAFHARDFVADDVIIPAGIFRTVNAVLIINEGSASAAEIFAAFVHEATGAARVGKKSYGKGGIQKIFPLEGEDALVLTIAEYFVGNQKIPINKIGIQPEYEVDNPKADQDNDSGGTRINPAKDPQLKKAIELLREPRT